MSDDRFAQRKARKIHASELSAEITAELAKRTAKEWEPVLQSAGVPAARLRSLPEALASEQIKTRGFIQSTDDGVDVPTLPFRIGGVDAYRPTSNAPGKGAHSDEIREWLGSI